MNPFGIAGQLYLLLGLIGIFALRGRRIQLHWILAALAPAFVLHTFGFTLRVVISGFAPVTNMYGTMLWVSLGMVICVVVLATIYREEKGQVPTLGWITFLAGAVLFTADQFPLVLSPDLDPIVAVLRSNFWLSTHVLTVTLSYAAFTVAMILGNRVLIASLFRKPDPHSLRTQAHWTYRMIQLGVFLLSTGIVLGGVWADYSWGRFWGWDPKETWALIADLGFLAILHARFLGWLKDFGVLYTAPFAYLLVVMAWYGVNFVLAAGLHSYGFSNGGTAAVLSFLGLQLTLLLLVGARQVTLGKAKQR